MNPERKSYRVSAIVSTYNARRFIGNCLEDLEAQTLADQTEIIVVDSGSEENEADIVRAYQHRYENIRYLRTTERETIYGAWNRGIELASGEFITNANSDDRHSKDAFERMVTVLDQRPDVALVYADVLKTGVENQTFDKCTPSGRIRWYDWDRGALLQKGCFIGPQPMWRKKVHEVFGGFDEALVSSGDYEFWLRISQLFNFYHIGNALGLYLERNDSVEHANADLKSAEDLKIQAEYIHAAMDHRLVQCRPLKRLRELLEGDHPQAAVNLPACMDALEPFICPDVQGRRIRARSETEDYLELKYRILSGKTSPSQSAEIIEALSRLMLLSMQWYRAFQEELNRNRKASASCIAPEVKSSAAQPDGTDLQELSN
jgi:glycosyltransferase involved in cell wall biosynthesis